MSTLIINIVKNVEFIVCGSALGHILGHTDIGLFVTTLLVIIVNTFA